MLKKVFWEFEAIRTLDCGSIAMIKKKHSPNNSPDREYAPPGLFYGNNLLRKWNLIMFFFVNEMMIKKIA
jgi:hypothetical protein